MRIKKKPYSSILTQLLDLFGDSTDNSFRAQLAKAGIGSLFIRIGNILLSLILSILLARSLGPEGYGIYAYVFTLASILAIPAQFGLPRLVIRETAKAQADNEWGLMRGVWRWTNMVAGALCTGLTLIALIVLWLMVDHFSLLQITTLLWGLALIPLMVLGVLRGAALQGLHHVVLGMLPEALIRPGCFIVMISLSFWWSAGPMTATIAMAMHVLATGLAFIVGVWLLLHTRPQQIIARPKPVYKTHTWLMAVWPLALTASIQQINKYTDIVMLGFFAPVAEIGSYRVAVQGMMLVVFGLQIVDVVVAPHFARMYAQQDYNHLQKLVNIGAKVSLLTALPVVLVIIFWGDVIIPFFFGTPYSNAYFPLMILAIGQLVNSAFGPVGYLLNMTGHEKDTLQAMMLAAIANILLNLILIPLFGMNGAAAATAITLCLLNIAMWLSAKKKLNINSFALSHSR